MNYLKKTEIQNDIKKNGQNIAKKKQKQKSKNRKKNQKKF